MNLYSKAVYTTEKFGSGPVRLWPCRNSSVSLQKLWVRTAFLKGPDTNFSVVKTAFQKPLVLSFFYDGFSKSLTMNKRRQSLARLHRLFTIYKRKSVCTRFVQIIGKQKLPNGKACTIYTIRSSFKSLEGGKIMENACKW